MVTTVPHQPTPERFMWQNTIPSHTSMRPIGRMYRNWQRRMPSLTMLASTPSGDAYTFAELESISQDAGFAKVEFAAPEIGLDRLVIAYR
jgi:hypothetical protein